MNMNTWRRYVPISLAVVFAILASVSVYFFLSDRNDVTHAAPISSTMPVVIAKEHIAIGEKIPEHKLELSKLSNESVPQNGFQSMRSVIGRTARYEINGNEPILESSLLVQGENFSSLIPDGMRAVTVAVKHSDALAQILDRGTVVDVITLMLLKGTGAIVAGTVVERAHVIAVHKGGAEGLMKTEAPVENMEVTLIVNPDEAKRIITAMNQGGIELIVRNDKDEESPIVIG